MSHATLHTSAAAHATHHHNEEPLMAHGSVLQTGITNGKIAMWLFLGSEVMFFTALIGAYIVLRGGQGFDQWPDPTKALNVPLTAANTFLLICSSVTLVWGLQSIQAGKKGKGNLGLLLTTIFGAVFVGIQGVEYYELWKEGSAIELAEHYNHEQHGADHATISPALAAQVDAYMELDRNYRRLGKEPNITLKDVKAFAAADSTHRTQTLNGLGKPTGNRFVPLDPLSIGAFAPIASESDRPAVEALAEFAREHWKFSFRPNTNVFGSVFYVMTGFHGLHVALGVLALAVLTVMGFAGKFGPDRYAHVELSGLYWHFVDLVWIILFAIVYLI